MNPCAVFFCLGWCNGSDKKETEKVFFLLPGCTVWAPIMRSSVDCPYKWKEHMCTYFAFRLWTETQFFNFFWTQGKINIFILAYIDTFSTASLQTPKEEVCFWKKRNDHRLLTRQQESYPEIQICFEIFKSVSRYLNLLQDI